MCFCNKSRPDQQGVWAAFRRASHLFQNWRPHPDSLKYEGHKVVLSLDENSALNIRDRIRIIPNHSCVVINMFDQVWLLSSDRTLRKQPIDVRGRVT